MKIDREKVLHYVREKLDNYGVNKKSMIDLARFDLIMDYIEEYFAEVEKEDKK